MEPPTLFWFLYVETCNLRQTPNTEPQKMHANRDIFWWRRQDLRLCDVNTNVWDSPNKNVFHSKAVIILFFSWASLYHFSVTHFNIEEILEGPWHSLSIFAEDRPSRLSFVWGHAHYVKGFQVRWCRHNLPYTGQSFVSSLIHKLRKYWAHNTALVTSGNSGLPRLNSSRKSSDIYPLPPTQSPIWVNPMGPIKLSFGKKCNNVITPGDKLQIYKQHKTCFYWMHVLTVQAQVTASGIFPWSDWSTWSTLSVDRHQRNSFSAECTCRLHAVVSMTLCGAHVVWHVNKPGNKSRTTPAWQLYHLNPA